MDVPVDNVTVPEWIVAIKYGWTLNWIVAIKHGWTLKWITAIKYALTQITIMNIDVPVDNATLTWMPKWITANQHGCPIEQPNRVHTTHTYPGCRSTSGASVRVKVVCPRLPFPRVRTPIAVGDCLRTCAVITNTPFSRGFLGAMRGDGESGVYVCLCLC